MLFNQSSVENRFRSWVEFIKSAVTIKDIALRSIEFVIQDKRYFLVPFCAADVSNKFKVSLLSSWRKAHEYAYPTRFEINDAGTQRWLKNLVVLNEQRVLFWVTDSDFSPIGHLGLILNEQGCIEVDNVLKGVKGHQRLFEFSMLELEELVKSELGTSALVLKVLGSNERAINFYERLGYKEISRKGLEWETHETSSSLVDSETPTEYLIVMSKNLEHNSEVPELILTAGPSISSREAVYVNEAVTTGWNSHHSDYIKAFEAEFAEKLGVKYAMTTSSCSGALHLSLLSLGIGKGDEVIVPDVTWVATASAVAYTGATPIFADVDKKSWNVSVETVAPLITSRTKAIIPVHLYGYGAPMNSLAEFAQANGLYLVEDAAPAIGTEINGKLAGSFGDFGCFSFQGAKLLVTGEGGMLVTNNKDLYEKAWKIQDHGRKPGTFWIEELGYKYKMNNITAALGLAQIQRADVQILRKREINSLYRKYLCNKEFIEFQEEIEGTKSICWMNSITLTDRISSSVTELASFLKQNGVDSRPVFPTIHNYPMWKTAVVNTNASYISERGLNLPSGVGLSNDSIYKVADLINKWVVNNAR
jgi:perosamine synthetase